MKHEAYPLSWPLGYKRTPESQRTRSQFKQTMERAQQFLKREMKLLGATSYVVSTNIPTRADGMFYADYPRYKVVDPGAAVYFTKDGEDRVLCCDNFPTVWENIYSLGKTIEALRAIERYGASEFLNRAFQGFKELPASNSLVDIWGVLGLTGKPQTVEEVLQAYRARAKEVHPDKIGGDRYKFQALQEAYQLALKMFE